MKISEDTLRQMFANRNATGDVTFQIGTKYQIKCHRNVLSALSQKYRAQFSDRWPAEDVDHVKTDVSPCAFKVFIACFYLTSPGLTRQNIRDVLAMAAMTLTRWCTKK